MEEILSSQEATLDRFGRAQAVCGNISKVHNQQVRHAKTWINGLGIPALSISYRALVHEPDLSLAALVDFLDCGEKLEIMQRVVDPALYRSRATNIA